MQKQQRRGYSYRRLLGFLAIPALLASTGCFPSSGSQFQQLLLQLTGGTGGIGGNTLTIRIINEAGTGITETLTLEIDGVQQSFSCSATEHLRDFTLDTCPQSVIAISERRSDTAGIFQGGRNFNGSDESFNFTAGEFECGQVILYRFSATEASASVY